MVIYSKFNFHRKKKFQLITVVEKENGRMSVFKIAQNKEAMPFLLSLSDKYKILKKRKFSIKPIKPVILNDFKVLFPYEENPTMDSLLCKYLLNNNASQFIKLFTKFVETIKDNQIINDTFGSDFKNIFGDIRPEIRCDFLQAGCLDLNFDNITINKKEDEFSLFDFEWTFDFPIPYKFVIFRALSSFYFTNYDYDPNKFVNLKELYEMAEISDTEQELFICFEYNFQKYVTDSFDIKFDDFKSRYSNLEKEKRVSLNYLQQKDSELHQKDQAIQQKDSELRQKDQAIQQKDSELHQKDQIIQLEEHLIQQKDSEVQKKDAEIAMMKSSKFWKLRDRYIRIKSVRPKHARELIAKGYGIFRKKGIRTFFWSFYKYILHGRGYFKTKPQLEKTKTDYDIWMEKNEKWNRNEIEKEIKNFKYKPKISIITPVYNVDSKWLDKCIESVRNQFYKNWELCLHDDASMKEETIKCLKKWQKKGEYRIKISFGKENQHISGASNEALKLATGEFIALLDNDDELSPDALFENVKILNQHSDADFIYSDEDKLEIDGKRVDPFFKPDWSPDLFLSSMYTCHLGVYRKSIIDEINGFKKGYEGSQDHDLVLRLMEKTDRRKILHIPKILYHWRKIIGSMAGKETAKGYASVTAKKALRDYLKRNNVKGEVLDGEYSGIYRVKRDIVGNPLVSIAIPFKDEVKVTRVCVNSVLTKTDYENFEILLVDNQSAEKKTMEYLESVKGNPKIRILEYNKPFNYSAINNFAVKQAKGEYIVFLNNDTEVISDGWLSAMLEHAQRKEVGAVGAKLLYPNNNIQHAGVIIGMGVAGHAFKYLSSNNHSYFSQLHTIKNYCSVTGACMMIRKKLFEDIGGLDEKNLSISFNDVDICLRLIEKGYYNVYTPYAELYHYESLSRGSDADKDLKQKNPEKYRRVKYEDDYMKKKWAKYIKRDPFYNPNLTKRREDFSIEID